MSILAFDVETLDLHADGLGVPLVFGYQQIGESEDQPAQLLSNWDYDQFYEDPRICTHFLRDMHKMLGQAETWLTYFGKGFDIKILNTFFLKAGLDPLPPVPHIDLYWTVKSNLQLRRKRLERVGEYFDCPTKKTEFDGEKWVGAILGIRADQEYLEDHCQRDVQILTWVYKNKLRPFVRLHPNLGRDDLGTCRYCGGDALQRRGSTITRNAKKARVQCTSCGAWDTRGGWGVSV